VKTAILETIENLMNTSLQMIDQYTNDLKSKSEDERNLNNYPINQ